MKTFKLLDLIIQTILISAGLTYGIISFVRSELNPFLPYVVVGCWQLISFLVHHFFFTSTIFQRDRIVYGRLLLGVLVLAILLIGPFLFDIVITTPFAFIFLISILIFSPIMAIYYLVTCWKEYRIMMQRELIHLK